MRTGGRHPAFGQARGTLEPRQVRMLLETTAGSVRFAHYDHHDSLFASRDGNFET